VSVDPGDAGRDADLEPLYDSGFNKSWEALMDVAEEIQRTFREKSDRRAIEFLGRWVTWGQVGLFAEELDRLLEAADVTAGGRVGLVARNRVANAAAMLALLSRRRTISLVYSMLSGPALAAEVRGLGAQAVIADLQDWPAMREACAGAGAAGIAVGGSEFLPRALEGLERSRLAEDAGGERRIEVLSSGTTGPPKRMPMPYHILDRALESAATDGADDAPPHISVWPISGIGGMIGVVNLGARGLSVVLMEKFEPHAFAEAVRRHRPSVLATPPTVLQMLLDAEIPREDLASVTAIFGGSAHLDPNLQDHFEETYGIPIYW
jgi:acyl-coenzyme A synthetase/AMP-(fatty) acid ligase